MLLFLVLNLVFGDVSALSMSTLDSVAPVSSSCSEAVKSPPINNRKLPNPLAFANGSGVLTKEDWVCKRQEILKDFMAYELGDLPPPPDSINATIVNNTMSVAITVQNKTVTMNAVIRRRVNSSIPSPAIIAIGGLSIPILENISTVTFANDIFAAQQSPDSRGQGLFYSLFGRAHSAGALTAWAWGIGRLIDGLEQLGPEITGIDTRRLGVSGCSRNGKGAIVAGAIEPRIALTIPQESGVGGSACWRVTADDIPRGIRPEPPFQSISENVWYSTRFNEWITKLRLLPIDHHELAGLIAPRGLFVLENDIDWLSPVSSTICMKAGRLIYEALGVPEHMGLSIVGGHPHCQFPANQRPQLNQYLDYFLLGGKDKPEITENSTITASIGDYVDWKAQVLS
jgi:hypothetical protein